MCLFGTDQWWEWQWVGSFYERETPQQSARQADRRTESNSPSEKRARSKKGRKSKVSVGASEGERRGGSQSRISRETEQDH